MSHLFSEVFQSLRGWGVRTVLLVGGLALCLLVLILAGKEMRERIRNWDRYTISFADIDCSSPPGEDRADFLAEVQYLTEMPAKLRLLDENLADKLAKAFARHPRVEKVESVQIEPPRQIHVHLLFRTNYKGHKEHKEK